MHKQKFFRCSATIGIGICGVFALCHAAQALEYPTSGVGMIHITLQQNAHPEMPAARFNHEVHVAKLGEKGKDCVICHVSLGKGNQKGQKQSFSVVSSIGKNRNDLKDSWHRTCFDCHEKYDQAPAPASCRSCHDADKGHQEQLPVKFDRSLHAAHVNSKYIPPVMPENAKNPVMLVKNCGACHTTTGDDGSPVYRQNTEDAFSFYHVESSDGSVLSSVAHNTCVSCHRETMLKQKASGKELSLPVLCSDCHSIEGQANFPKDNSSFRLLRGQPDEVVLGEKPTASLTSQSTSPEAAIKAVPFNHKLHEESASCTVCHGMKIEQNEAKPATLAGRDAEGRKVTAYDAAHDVDSASSCVGCHIKTVAENKNCAGCHNSLTFEAKDSCFACHRGADEPVRYDADNSLSFPQFPKRSRTVATPISPDDIPEKVVIGSLSNEYQPVELPHRKIYQTLLKGMEDNELAATFHRESVCKACHHNIPNDNIASPPACSSCHDKEIKSVAVGQLPHLKAAYHQMCIRCHTSMDVEPASADCAGCHAPVNSKDSNMTKREVR